MTDELGPEAEECPKPDGECTDPECLSLVCPVHGERNRRLAESDVLPDYSDDDIDPYHLGR
jgi:hypothetical protein